MSPLLGTTVCVAHNPPAQKNALRINSSRLHLQHLSSVSRRGGRGAPQRIEVSAYALMRATTTPTPALLKNIQIERESYAGKKEVSSRGVGEGDVAVGFALFLAEEAYSFIWTE